VLGAVAGAPLLKWGRSLPPGTVDRVESQLAWLSILLMPLASHALITLANYSDSIPRDPLVPWLAGLVWTAHGAWQLCTNREAWRYWCHVTTGSVLLVASLLALKMLAEAL